MMERAIVISEDELNILVEALDALEKRNLANAERTKTGYGSVRGQVKREAYIEKAKLIRELCTKIAYEFI